QIHHRPFALVDHAVDLVLPRHHRHIIETIGDRAEPHAMHRLRHPHGQNRRKGNGRQHRLPKFSSCVHYRPLSPARADRPTRWGRTITAGGRGLIPYFVAKTEPLRAVDLTSVSYLRKAFLLIGYPS